VGEDGLARLLCRLVFCLSFGGDGGASLGEGGREVGRGVVEGGAGVADGDEDEFNASQISLEGAKEGVVLFGLLDDLGMAAEVSAKADLE
jgi:hypothetical protein